jgi:glycosyltransferase involved in cell wall biosynthesis
MIVKNEEDVLRRCLESAAPAVDEIIIVDTGSADKTKEIAREFTDKIYDFEWINDFSAARNHAYSKATMDYQMWLDADDILPPKTVKMLNELKETLDPNIDIVTMKYITHFDEHGVPILISTRERLTKREKNYKWQDPVHECIPMVGAVLSSEMEVHHRKNFTHENPNRNLDIYDTLEKSGAEMTPRQQYYFARELKDHMMWAKAVYYFEKFLDGGKGWVEDNIGTCYNLATCYRQLGDMHKVMPILTKSFLYDAPRAEICSEIGYYYKNLKDFATSLKWFDFAANIKKPNTAGFVLWDYYGFIPNIECCVCCCELGDYEKGRRYNEKAATFKPKSPQIEHNRKFFADHFKQNKNKR